MIRAAALLVLVALTIAGGAAIVIATTDGDEQRSSRAEATQEPASVSPGATPEPTRAPAAAATAAPTPLPDRTNCAEIKGTPYRSDSERAFYLTSCSAPSQAGGATAANVAQDTSPACSTDVQIKTNRSDKTFNVSGTTVDQINASLLANGPVVDGEKAVGLTEYSYGIDGSYCTRTAPDIRALWDSFAERVRIHENRHVTIVEEGLVEMKRQLLLVEQQPKCDSLDHEVDKVWLLNISQIAQRQSAFHAADRSGQGGSVVR